MASYGWVPGYITQRARALGLDPAAVHAIAAQEGSSGWGGRSVTAGIGDSGTSFGPWQLHWGGAYPAFAPHGSAQAAQAWAMSKPGIDYALSQIAGVAKGLRGKAAIESIVRRFERPAAPDPEISRAWAAYGKYGNLPAAAAAAPPPPSSRTAAGKAGTPARRVQLLAPETVRQFDPSKLSQGIFSALATGETPDIASLVQQSYKNTRLPGVTKVIPARPGTKLDKQGKPTGKPPTKGATPVVGGWAIPGKGKVIGTPGAGTHTLGNWESDRALDIAMKAGSPIYAPFGGTIGSQFGSLGAPGSSRFAGLRLHVVNPKNEWYGAHLSRFAPGIRPGVVVKPGQLIGYSGSASGVEHLHEGLKYGNPYRLI
jgi:murein DD-endopeptidase MepM/ murein hydrolase activator NlpD